MGLAWLAWVLVGPAERFWNQRTFFLIYALSRWERWRISWFEFGFFSRFGGKVRIDNTGPIPMNMVWNLAKSHTVVDAGRRWCVHYGRWSIRTVSKVRELRACETFPLAYYIFATRHPRTLNLHLRNPHMISPSYAAFTGTACCGRSGSHSDHGNVHRRRESGCSEVKREYRSMAGRCGHQKEIVILVRIVQLILVCRISIYV